MSTSDTLRGEQLTEQHQRAVKCVREMFRLKIHASLLTLAQMFRKGRDLHPTEGWVIFYSGKPFGWNATLNPANEYRPGCLAINANGELRMASGGNNENGAERWEEIK
jgi:hypothetical protein